MKRGKSHCSHNALPPRGPVWWPGLAKTKNPVNRARRCPDIGYHENRSGTPRFLKYGVHEHFAGP